MTSWIAGHGEHE